MTRPDLDSLAALLDKATPGLWRVDCVGEDEEMVMRTIHGKPSAGGSEVCIVTTGSYDDATEAKNADLIVAAVNALPALLAYVRELERERDALADEAGAMLLRAEAAESDLKEDRYDNMQEWKRIAALAMRERCAQLLNITRSDAQLMAGDMTAGEWRTVSAVLRSRAAAIRALEP